ncbi:MAG: hypothetical protein GY941_19940 [Planctomycetes bacterium]|nr:hypothetical protein [Planctomycetota bacterium]
MKVEQHPDKTFIGRVERGFDFLGYYLKPGIISVAVNTIKRFALRVSRLYEQGADYVRIGEYMMRWLRWVRAGVKHCILQPMFTTCFCKLQQKQEFSGKAVGILRRNSDFCLPSLAFFC